MHDGIRKDDMCNEMWANDDENLFNSNSRTSNSSSQNNNHSPLLNLPAELRNEIFRNVSAGLVTQIYLVHEHFCLLDKWHLYQDVDMIDVRIIDNHGHLKRPPYPLVLLQTCRQIQQEATALAFSMIDFELSATRVSEYFPPCLTFLTGLRYENRAAIATLKVDGMNAFNQEEAEKSKDSLSQILGQLPGLKRIVVLMEHHEEDSDDSSDQHARDTDAQASMVLHIFKL